MFFAGTFVSTCHRHIINSQQYVSPAPSFNSWVSSLVLFIDLLCLVLPELVKSYTVLQVQVVPLVLLEFVTVIVHLDKTWSDPLDIFTFLWRKPQDLHEEKWCRGFILHRVFGDRHKMRRTRLGSMPDCRMVSTTRSVSLSVSGLYRSNKTWMLLSLARESSSSKEGTVWFLAICLSSSERFHTEQKGSVWKVRKQMFNAIFILKSTSALFCLECNKTHVYEPFPCI